MQKITYLTQLEEAGIVAVIRGNSDKEAIESSRAAIQGGITAIEVTFTTPNAQRAIETLVTEYKHPIIIGAGTVLDATTARIAIMAGAQFIVGPSFDQETAKLCNRYQIPYLPGCMTIAEMQQALSYGADIIKLFPGSLYGPSVVPTIKAPLPQINLMPTGGVDLANLADWFAAGVIAVGVGGNLVKGDAQEITKMAQEYCKKLKEIRNK